LKIVVNTRLLLPNKLEGIGWFTLESLKRITMSHPEHEFLFLFDRAFNPDFIFNSNVRGRIVFPPTRHPILWYIWFQIQLPRLLKKEKPDLFLSPDGYLPLGMKIPSVDVIHDINFAHRPMDLPPVMRFYYNHYFPKFAKEAKRIATVSEYSKNDIVKTYGISPDLIDVVYNGANEQYVPISDQEKAEAKQKYTGGCDYFLFVGSLHPRKNVGTLLRAFDLFREQFGKPFKLIIVGEPMFSNDFLTPTYNQMKHKDEVVFSGRLTPPELKQVLGAARALTFVPLFEGFGIPLVEAMYSGIPLLSSNVTSLPEVASDAALYVDPLNVNEIASGMLQLATDDVLVQNLIEKGQKRKNLFSWNRTAELLWQCIEKAL